jgi:hypothetical protein
MIHPANVWRYSEVIDPETGDVYPESDPFGVPNVPTREEQVKLRAVEFRTSLFDPHEKKQTFTLKVGVLYHQAFVLRAPYDAFDPFRPMPICWPRGPGLFIDGIELSFVSTNNLGAIAALIISDRCSAWPAIHDGFERVATEVRAALIERRRQAWRVVRARIEGAQNAIARVH